MRTVGLLLVSALMIIPVATAQQFARGFRVTMLGAMTAGVLAALLGVTHAPYQRVLNAYVELGTDAIFGGHTHGGQVCLPGFGALVANCDIPLKQAKGLSTWSRGERTVPLNVSAGCGRVVDGSPSPRRGG